MALNYIRKKAGNVLMSFVSIPLGYHIIAAFIIRLFLVFYGNYHDAISDVKYTDVDYKVLTDGARLIVAGASPYDRHTYRYSPLIACMLVPNIFVQMEFGKILFCIFDIIIASIIKFFVQYQLKNKIYAKIVGKYCALLWLYNPLSIGISTRGSADSIPSFLVLLSVFFLHYHDIRSYLRVVMSGMFLGIAIHIRLYPIIFSFPMFLSLGNYRITRNTTIRQGLIALIPNWKQVVLALTTIFYFVALTYSMYYAYGYKFIFETYIYHLFRNDTKHNFSVFFYNSYLTMGDMTFDLIKFTAQIFVVIILLILSLAFGCNPRTLPFAMFCQALVLVTYNSVVTSQYFIWYLSLLPLIIHDIKMKPKDAMFLTVSWIGSQVLWLSFAYCIEFQNQNMFLILWLMCILFFVSNIMVLVQIIAHFRPGYAFGVEKQVSRPKTE